MLKFKSCPGRHGFYPMSEPVTINPAKQLGTMTVLLMPGLTDVGKELNEGNLYSSL